jgi:hypothetical protein
MFEMNLGSENDDARRLRMGRAVEPLGGSLRESSWKRGGSQERVSSTISLPEGQLERVSETCIGILLPGEEALVRRLASAVTSST